LVGRPVPEKKGVYVKREGEPGVILTAEAVWTVFPKTVGAIRDKTVVSYASDKLARIEITRGRETLALAKEGTGWKITAPEALRADSGAVTQILWKIRDLQALGFLSEGAAEVPRFLSKPEVIVRLWRRGRRSRRRSCSSPPASAAAVSPPRWPRYRARGRWCWWRARPSPS
jgi:hypothetical protein